MGPAAPSSPPLERVGAAPAQSSLPTPAPPAAPAQDEDAGWVRSARRGDRDAFRRLVERHQDAVLTTARYMSGSQEDADDIAQETFLRAWRSLAGFAGTASFRTWILVIAGNAARSLAARRRTRKRSGPEVRLEAVSGEGTPGAQVPDPAGSPEDLAVRRETKEAIEAAILALDPEIRDLVVLRDLLGLPYEEIAATRGLALGTVKSRIHRARMELRESLQKHL